MLTAGRRRIASVDTGEWILTIDEVTTETHGTPKVYDACLKSADGVRIYSLNLWKDLPTVWESLAGYLRSQGLSHVAAALRASCDAEWRP